MRLHLSFVHITLLVLSMMALPCQILAAPLGSPPGLPDSCDEWTMGQHEPSREFQLACIRRMERTGALKAVPLSMLESELGYFYPDVGTTGSRASAGIIRLLVNEIERRSRPPKGQRSDTIYSALISSGQLKEAQEERRIKKLDVPELPLRGMRYLGKADPSSALSWTFDSSYSRLTEGATDLTQGPRIVVYCMPGCGPCGRAASDLAADPRLRTIFRNHSIWVDAPDINFSAEAYSEWHRDVPDFPLHTLFKRQNWPQRSLPATPTFFFMKDGKVMHEMLGWTSENKVKLEQYLAELELSELSR